MRVRLAVAALAVLTASFVAYSQTTNFSYQGRLMDGALAANGTYEFQFRLYDTDDKGTLLGTLDRGNVPVTNGIFAVHLDFGAMFSGDERWLEIAVRLQGDTEYTTLQPRQELISVPYSVHARNASLLGGLTPEDFVRNSSPQQQGNFILSGNGSLGGNLSVGGDLVVAGTITGNGANLTSLNGSNITSGTIAEQRLDIAGSLFGGTIGVDTSNFPPIPPPFLLTLFGSPSGTSLTRFADDEASFLFLNARHCTGQSFMARMRSNGGTGDGVTITVTLRVNQTDTGFGCAFTTPATSCSAPPGTTVDVPAGAETSIKTTIFVPALSIVAKEKGVSSGTDTPNLFFHHGWECR